MQLMIHGMSCASCVQAVENGLKELPGISSVSLNFVTGIADIQSDTSVTQEMLIDAVKKTGYHASPLLEPHKGAGHQEQSFHRFILSLALTLPLIFQMIGSLTLSTPQLPGWIQAILAGIVQVWLGKNFYRKAGHALHSKSANMDLLVALGTTAAYGFSLATVLFDLPYPLYFESSALIITLVLFGKWLEDRAKANASSALQKLMEQQPKSARVKRDGEFTEIPIAQIRIDDLFYVREGEKVAVDAELIEGKALIDESMMTGESIPKEKEIGEELFAATVNIGPPIVAKAKRIGRETLFGQIIDLVRAAQSSKAPIQKLVDKVCEWFVPLVVAIASLTLILWLLAGDEVATALIKAVSVLVIACPCALGLATPVVITVATGLGADLGILFKDAVALQETGNIETVIFDKTGTLTTGKPKVSEILPQKNISSTELMQIALSLEELSQHPLAKAIQTYAKRHKIHSLPTTNIDSQTGRGITATIKNRTYSIGSYRFARENAIPVDSDQLGILESQGKHPLLLWSGKELLGIIALTDQLRTGSKKAIDRLHKMGISTSLLTGDDKHRARGIAGELGIDHVVAEVLPQLKAEKVRAIQSIGKKVGMVGDGINDAPALAMADIGFAMHTGTDIAIEASDVTLMHSDPEDIPRAILLSQKSVKKIWQNLFFAFIYNVLGIPLAALGFLSPIIAALAMSLSSVSVVTNALLLKYFTSKS